MLPSTRPNFPLCNCHAVHSHALPLPVLTAKSILERVATGPTSVTAILLSFNIYLTAKELMPSMSRLGGVQQWTSRVRLWLPCVCISMLYWIFIVFKLQTICIVVLIMNQPTPAQLCTQKQVALGKCTCTWQLHSFLQHCATVCTVKLPFQNHSLRMPLHAYI